MSTIYADQPCADPNTLLAACQDQGLPVDWYGKPNQFVNPLGRGPGAGWVLLTKGDLDAIDLTTDHDLVFLDSRQRSTPRTLKKITLLRASCLTPGYEQDDNAHFLAYVVDRRHFLAKIPVNKNYNLKNADGTGYLSGSQNSGSPWTWQTLVGDLWNSVLGLGTTPTLPYAFTTNPEEMKFDGSLAWERLNQVLDALGCTVRYDVEADTFSIIKLGDTAATGAAAATAELAKLDRRGDQTWNNFWDEPDRGRLPEKIRVLFPRRPQPSDGSAVYYAKDITLAATAGVVAGTVEVLYAALVAVGTGATPTNASALTTRATEMAARWREKRLNAEARQTISYRDFRDGPTLLCETIGTVVYDDRGGAMRTELNSEPDGLMEGFRPFIPPLNTAGGGSDEADCSGLAHVDPEDTKRLTFSTGRTTGGCEAVDPQSTDATGAGDVWVAKDLFTLPTGLWRARLYKRSCDFPDGKMTITRENPDDSQGSGTGSGPAEVECGVFGGCRDGSFVYSFGGKVVCGAGGQPAYYMVCLQGFTDTLTAFNVGMVELALTSVDHWSGSAGGVTAALVKSGDTYTLTLNGTVVYSGPAPADYADTVDLAFGSGGSTGPAKLTLIPPGTTPCDPGTIEILVSCDGGTVTTACGEVPRHLCLTVLGYGGMLTGGASPTTGQFPDIFFLGRRVSLVYRDALGFWLGYFQTDTVDLGDAEPDTPDYITRFLWFRLQCVTDGGGSHWQVLVDWWIFYPTPGTAIPLYGGSSGLATDCVSTDPFAMQLSTADGSGVLITKVVIAAGDCADQACAKDLPLGFDPLTDTPPPSPQTALDTACNGLIPTGTPAVVTSGGTDTDATWSGSSLTVGLSAGSLHVFWRSASPPRWVWTYTPAVGSPESGDVTRYACLPPVMAFSSTTLGVVEIKSDCDDLAAASPPPPPPPASYDCVTVAGTPTCVGRPDTSGAYPTLGDCVADGCAASPPPPPPPALKYGCHNLGFGQNTCIPDPGGAYATLVDCQTAGCGPPDGCAACDLLGNAATLTVFDGPNAGSYTATWALLGDVPHAVFTVGPHTVTVTCVYRVGAPGNGYYVLSDVDGTGTIDGSVVSAGPPAVFSLGNPAAIGSSTNSMVIT